MRTQRKILLSLLAILAVIAIAALSYYFGTQSPGVAPPLEASQPAHEARDSLPPSSEGTTMEQESIEEPAAVVTPPPPGSAQEVLDFAHSQAGMMDEAMESERAGIEAFHVLESCVNQSQEESALQARLICFANARTLAGQYGGILAKRYERLEERYPKLAEQLKKTGL